MTQQGLETHLEERNKEIEVPDKVFQDEFQMDTYEAQQTYKDGKPEDQAKLIETNKKAEEVIVPFYNQGAGI